MIKVLVILGPTASGKSDLAVRLALEFNGEVISADSRQVYKGLDIGTGKITPEEMRGVRHHLLDIADPKERFTVVQWKRLAEQAVADIHLRGKLPIIAGGTGYYISALIDNLEFPAIESDPHEQKRLESKPAEELFAELAKLDPRRAGSMKEHGEATNRRRLARAIIVARKSGSVPLPETSPPTHRSPDAGNLRTEYDTLLIGLTLPDADLKAKIHSRLVHRIETGMIEEVRRLHERPPVGYGLSDERMDELGLEYRYLALFLQGKLTKEQLIEDLTTKIWQYARRQKTWFKRDKKIHWFESDQIKDTEELIEDFARQS